MDERSTQNAKSIAHLPLNALRAFEATARLGSMTAAAKELWRDARGRQSACKRA